MIRVGVFGAAGRMGRQNLKAVHLAKGLHLSAAIEHEGHARLGENTFPWFSSDPGSLLLRHDLSSALADCDVVIDFSTPEATLHLAEEAASRGVALVIGTTGLKESGREALQRAAQKIPVVFSGNYSLGVNVLLALVRQASALLPGYDIEIVEHHHNQKKDAPSGTALMLGTAAAEGRGQNLQRDLVPGRHGDVGPRQPLEIGMHAVRGGGIVGYHEVFLAGPDETVRLSHQAQSREAFTSGVVRAAAWVHQKKAGLYDMSHVLGLTDC